MVDLIAALLMFFPFSSGPPDARPDPAASFQTLARQAEEARDANRFDEALALYKRALKLKPGWDEGWWNLGSIAYDRDKYAECAPAFRRLTALKPDLTPAWTMSGLCEYRLRQYDAALESLRHAERLRFEEAPELSRAARLHLALLLTKTGSFEKAITVLAELTKIERKTSEISVAAGIAGLRKPWLPFEVPEAHREMVAKLGDAMAVAMELDYKGAIERFEVAVRDYPAEPNIHFRFGAFLIQQTPDRGIAEIRKALDLDPAHVPALVGLTMIYLKRQEPQIARGYAETAVKTSPGDFATHIALGRTLLETDDPAGAARELELAIKLMPDSAEARYSLASAYTRLGRKRDAERQQEEFKRLRKLVN